MRKRTLVEWAALGELVASVAVVVSLYFLIVGINQNTAQARADGNSAVFERVTNIELAVAADDAWSEIVVKGRRDAEQLTEKERFRFDVYLVANTDSWDEIVARYETGFMSEEAYAGWELYFTKWAERNVSQQSWDRIRWNYYEEAPFAIKLRSAAGIK